MRNQKLFYNHDMQKFKHFHILAFLLKIQILQTKIERKKI